MRSSRVVKKTWTEYRCEMALGLAQKWAFTATLIDCSGCAVPVGTAVPE